MDKLTNFDIADCLCDLYAIAKDEQEYQGMEARFMREFNDSMTIDVQIEDCLGGDK